MLFLTKEDMMQIFSMRDAIEADKTALKSYSSNQAKVPLRTSIDITEAEGISSYMPAYVAGDKLALGIKIVSTYPQNIDKGLPSVPGTMIVLNPETGIVSAMLDGTYLTQLRTGAVQGAATDILARKDAKIGALIGTGGQAASQLEAMLTVRDLTEVRIFDMDQERCQAFAQQMQEQFETKMIPAKTNEECVIGADIITTVTPSKQPTFSAEWIKAGAHVNGIGSFTPEMREVPRELLKKADRIIFDTMDGVLNEAGDFMDPVKGGYISREKYNGELGQVILGEIDGRTSDDQITVFKSTGTAVLDVVVADCIVTKAQELSLGKTI